MIPQPRSLKDRLAGITLVGASLAVCMGLYVASRALPGDSSPAPTAASSDKISSIASAFRTVAAEPPQSSGQNLYLSKLEQASTITVDETSLSWGKKYYILADGQKVGEVTGKTIPIFGDTFEFKTADGALVAYEDEKKREFRFSYNRLAVCYDANKRVTGFIGEESLRDWFSLKYILHIYNQDQQEIGKSEKFTNSAVFGNQNIFGAGGSKDYHIKKHVVLMGGDTYDIQVLNKQSSVPRVQAIFVTCIEDAIGDAHKDD